MPQVLKEVGKDLLIEFCGQFTSNLAAKNLTVPDPHSPDDAYFKALASLLQAPALLPDSIKEALFDIEEMARPEQSEYLKEAVAEAGFANATPEGVCHERLALQLWLARPDLLIASQNKQTLLTPFDGFARSLGQVARPAMAPPPPAGSLEEMSSRLHLWFRERNPQAPKVKIELYFNKPGEFWFLVSQGDTCRWIYNFQTDQPELIHFRPDGQEALVCFGYEDLCWIVAKSNAVRDLYRQQFSLFLRGDADYFDQPCALTLEPLRISVADTLNPRGLEGISKISLLREELGWRGAAHERTTIIAENLEQTKTTPPVENSLRAGNVRLAAARFLIRFSDSVRSRVVEICPPYTVRLERASDLAAVSAMAFQPRPHAPANSDFP